MSETSNYFSSYDRQKTLKRLSSEEFDLVVVGGGATGTGIALDAASRGLKTALVEKGDFASGTSSKSTKLIHGGLRYLKQFDIGLVRETGTEREVVNQIAPHLCLPEKMLLPLYKGGTFGKYSTSVALWVYDRVANVDASDRRVMLSRSDALVKEPLLNDRKLEGAGYYAEFRTDDARLTIELIKKAAHFGASSANYVEVMDFKSHKGKISGVHCKDHLSGKLFEIKGKKVVCAGGHWIDKLRKKNHSVNGKKLQLTKGVHIVIPQSRFPLKQAIYFDVPDGRMIFAIPRGRVTYVGTTDTVYTASLDRVVATEEDREYLIKAINNMFPGLTITRFDIVSNWAGLRSLIHEEGKKPSELSRKDEVFESEDGLVSIAGGKLTGYRKIAQRVVDKVLKQLSAEDGRKFVKTKTKEITLTPCLIGGNADVKNYISRISEKCLTLGLEEYFGWYLVTNYGSQADEILADVQVSDDLDSELSLQLAELRFCLNHEMVQKIEDFYVRRTGRLYFDINSIQKYQSIITSYMAKQLKWSPKRIEEEKKRMALLIEDATTYYQKEFLQT